MQGINIIICTYNRLEYLKQCLAILLSFPAEKSFIITVVDNNSTDDTKSYVAGLMQIHGHVRYVHAPQQGLSHARNAGWKSSDLEWTLFLDDDSVPGTTIIDEAFDLIDQHPEASAFGGPIDAIFENPPPDWLPDGFGTFNLPYHQFTYIDENYIRGGCLMVRKNVFESIGGFDPSLGISTKLGYGEEIELQTRMRKHQMLIGYAPSLRIGHHVRTEKLTTRWILQSEYARRRDKMRFDPVSPSAATLGMLKTIGGRLFRLPVYAFRLLTKKKYTIDHAMLDVFKPIMYRAGELMGVIKNHHKW